MLTTLWCEGIAKWSARRATEATSWVWTPKHILQYLQIRRNLALETTYSTWHLNVLYFTIQIWVGKKVSFPPLSTYNSSVFVPGRIVDRFFCIILFLTPPGGGASHRPLFQLNLFYSYCLTRFVVCILAAQDFQDEWFLILFSRLWGSRQCFPLHT